jgi:biopolymer transport protein ExbD
MAGGSLGGDDDDGITGINVTPLVDIMLVLLIIFMVASSYIVKESIEVSLPKAATGEDTVGESLAFKITKDGQLLLNDKPITKEEIAAKCKAVAAKAKAAKARGEKVPEPTAMIAADKEVSHGKVTALIDWVRINDVTNFAISIQPADGPEL